MKKSIEKIIDNIMGQIDLIDIQNARVEELRYNVLREWDTLKKCDKLPKGSHLELKRMLHATRAFDTGLRMFLEKHGGFRGTMPSIGGYVTDLKVSRPTLNPLNDKIAKRIKDDVANNRNKYMHTANSYPNKAITDSVIINILQYYNVILTLAK